MPFSLKKFATIVTIVFAALIVIKSFHYSFKYPGVDLRMRVVGTRLLNSGHSPYFYKWNPADGDYYFNPGDRFCLRTNGNVVTPATMYVFYPLYILPYKDVRFFWTVIQLIFVFGAIYLLSRSSMFSDPNYLTPAMVIITTFIGSDIFFFNIERGQIYIVYTFLFALMYYLYNSKTKFNNYLSGFVLGITIFFRPIAIVIGWPFLLQRNFKWVFGAIIGFIVGCVLFVLPHWEHWTDYFAAMKEYSNAQMGKATILPPPIYQVPSVIEGITGIRKTKDFSLYGLPSLQGFLSLFKIHITSIHTIVGYGLIVVILSVLYKRKKSICFPQDKMFLFGFLLYIFLEVLMVAPRCSYNVIQWMFPLFIAWKYIVSYRRLLIISIFSILIFHQFPISYSFSFISGGYIAESLLIIVTCLILFHNKMKDTITYKRLSET